MTDHPALAAGRTALITGAASGIGLAAARAFAGRGMRLILADRDAAGLEAALDRLGDAEAIAVPTDVSDRASMAALKAAADGFGAVDLLMSNAAREGGGGILKGEDVWRATLDTNLWGTIHALQLFLPDMIAAGTPGAVVVTGSKQGITLPPGDTAYNVSKAALKALTESLAHDLLGTRLTAHLLIPGFTFTGLTRAAGVTEKPAAAWTPDQVVEFLIPAMAAGDFYILCPDNDVSRALDEKRIAWAAGDIIENRPALSRWHPDHAAAFRSFLED